MPQTGATRRQKFLKSEKSKTKLKAKKELPKGTNVTKTNFKVKKIVIKEQLKTHTTEEALSARKLSVKELLSRLNHFNVHTRTDALEGLKELSLNHPRTLEQNLGLLINGVTPMILNIEKVVRRDALKVLQLFLSTVNTDKIEPFFSILSTYLRSAMTHIDNRIQEDSLLFLDLLLLCTPERMAIDFHKILPNFINMISKLRLDSKPGRTLSVNMNSQITSVKWRVQVLHRFKEFLHRYIHHCNIENMETDSEHTFVKFDEKNKNYHSLFNPTHTMVCQLNLFSAKSAEESSIVDEVEKFKSYIETLMPLMFESWLEVIPNVTTEKNIEMVISEDAASLLKHSLEVFASIWSLILYIDKRNPSSEVKSYFCQKYRHTYNKHFVDSFPYITNVRSKRTKSIDMSFESNIIDPKLLSENLTICYLFITFNSKINLKQQHSQITSVLKYIEKSFNRNGEAAANDLVIKILDTIFSNKSIALAKNFSLLEGVFRKMIWAYFNKDINLPFQQKIFALLCDIALNDNLSHFLSNDAYEMWLKNLPDILMAPSVTMQTIDTIHRFSICNNKTFNSVIKGKLLEILENLPKLIISDSNNDTDYHKLFSLLYWIKIWDVDTLNLLEKQLIEGVYKKDYGNFIYDTLQLRSGIQTV